MAWALSTIGQLAQIGCASFVLALGTIETAHAQIDVLPREFAYFHLLPFERSFRAPDLNVFEPFYAASFLRSASEQTSFSTALTYSIRASERLTGDQLLISNPGGDSWLFANWPSTQRTRRWELGGFGIFSYQGWNQNWHFGLRYGTVFNGPHESYEGDHSVGLQIQFVFGKP